MKRVLSLMAIILLALIVFPAYSQKDNDLVRFGSDAVVREGEMETGSVVVFGGNATIDGTVEDDVVVFGGDIRLSGETGGNVVNFGGNTFLGEGAVVGGDLIHFGGSVNRAPGATVAGDEVTGIRIFRPITGFFFSLLNLLFTLAIAAVVVALLPRETAVLADTIEREPLRSVGIGFLATILIPVLFLLLAVIIIIGWLLIPFVALAIPIIYFYGYVGVSRWLGRRIIDTTRLIRQSPIAQVLTGVLVLGIIGFIPILGWLIVVIAALFGLGAVIISKFGTGRPWRRSVQQPPPESGSQGAA